MKKFTVLSVFLLLGACSGYENLSTPFHFNGAGINLFGSNSTAATGQANAYEVVVNAPAGTSEAVANQLFDAEAKKNCQGRPYQKVITSTGNATIRDFGVKGVNTTQTVQDNAPSLRGYVTCQ